MTRLNARLPIVAFLILLGCPLPTTIQLAGRGVHLPNFDLPIGNRYPVTVQLHSATQTCWQSTFEESDLRNDHPGLLRARSH